MRRARSSIKNRVHPWRPIVALGFCSCAPASDGDPSAEVGRMVVMINNTDREVCEATVETLDGFIEAALLELDVEPPDEPFITYRWEDAEGMAQSPCPVAWNGSIANCAARGDGGTTTIYARSPYHLHEVAHAVHHFALPDSMPVLQEGFAEFLNDRIDPFPYEPDLVDDWEAELGEATALKLDYGIGHALVYETVYRYGFDGLLDLWLELPKGSSGAELQDAYFDLFGEDVVDVLEGIEGVPQRLMLSCSSPSSPVVLTPPFEVSAPLECGPGVAGLDKGALAIRTQVVRIEEAGVYRFFPTGGGSGRAAIYPCVVRPGPYHFAILGLSEDDGPMQAALPVGEYLLDMDYATWATDSDPVSFLLERVE